MKRVYKRDEKWKLKWIDSGHSMSNANGNLNM